MRAASAHGPEEQPTVRLEVLGPPQARQHQRTVPLDDRRPDEVLAVVAASPGAEASAALLLDTIWDRADDRRGLDVLKNAVYQLNRRLQCEFGVRPLIAAGSGYRLAPAVTLDAARFELESARLTRTLLDQPRSGVALEEVQHRVEAALASWRGEHAFAGLDRTSVVSDRARSLRRQRQRVARVGFECALALNRHGAVVDDLGAALQDDPYDESLCGLLMMALARSGRRREALNVFVAFRRRLIEGVGVEPSAGLRDLEHRLLVDDAELAWRPGELAEQAARSPAPTSPPPQTRVDTRPLSPRARLAVQAASIGGSPFTLDSVAAVVGHEPDAVDAWLDEAVTAGLVAEARHQPGHYRLLDAAASWGGAAMGHTHRRRLHLRWAATARGPGAAAARRRATHLIEAAPLGPEEELGRAVLQAVARSRQALEPEAAHGLLGAAVDAVAPSSPVGRHLRRIRHDDDHKGPGAPETTDDPDHGGGAPGLADGDLGPTATVVALGASMAEGRFDAALALTARLEDRATGPDAVRQRWWALVARSAINRVHGRFEVADRLSDRAHRLGRTIDVDAADTSYALQLHDSLWWAGTVGTMTDVLAASATPAAPPLAHLMVTQAYLTDERSAEATRCWDAWSPTLPTVARDEQWLPTMALAAELVTSGIDDRAAAEWLWEELTPHAGRWVMVGRTVACWGPIDGYRAALALTLGRRADAESALGAARAQCLRAGAPYWGDRLWPLFNRVAG
ncbi:MAG: AfsR/SARP family transcriptional regulator [Actinomycetota bacterium]